MLTRAMSGSVFPNPDGLSAMATADELYVGTGCRRSEGSARETRLADG